MPELTIEEKLRVLLPHWIDHNTEHAAEFRRWAEQAGAIKADIEEAAQHVEKANAVLARALEELGGGLTPPGHDHSHGHSHDHGH